MVKIPKVIFAVLGAAILGIAACSSATQNSAACSSIAGTWHWHRLQSGGTANWARSTEAVTSDCTVTQLSYRDNTGDTTLSPSATWSLDSSGIITRADVPTFRGMAMSGNQMIVSTRTAGDGVSVRMAIALKAGSGFAQTDLAGTHNVLLLRTGTSPMWAYGTVTHDATGNATSFWYNSAGGSGAGVASVQTLNTAGVITDSLNTTWEGRFSTGKEIMAATATMPDGSLDLIVGAGTATGFSTADLAGTWRWHRLQVGAGSHWARGRVSVDGTGAVTQLSYSDSTGDNTIGSPFTLTIDAAGAISRADSPSFHGQMLASKNAVIAVQSNGTGDAYRLVIFRKD